MRKALAEVVRDFGRVDVFVANAGEYLAVEFILQTDIDQGWRSRNLY